MSTGFPVPWAVKNSTIARSSGLSGASESNALESVAILVVHYGSKFFDAAEQPTARCSFIATDFVGDLHKRHALEMVHHNDLAKLFRKLLNCSGQVNQYFFAVNRHAGRCVRRYQPIVDLTKRAFDLLGEINLSVLISLLTFPVSSHIDQPILQNPFQPSDKLSFAGTTKFFAIPIDFKESLLDEIRSIDFLLS